MVPRDGIEPSTLRSSGACSTTELPGQIFLRNFFKELLYNSMLIIRNLNLIVNNNQISFLFFIILKIIYNKKRYKSCKIDQKRYKFKNKNKGDVL